MIQKKFILNYSIFAAHRSSAKQFKKIAHKQFPINPNCHTKNQITPTHCLIADIRKVDLIESQAAFPTFLAEN